METTIDRPITDIISEYMKLVEALKEIRDLARTGTAPDCLGFTSLAEWEHYKINRIAGMAAHAIAKME